jgi:hypothetical protein
VVNGLSFGISNFGISALESGFGAFSSAIFSGISGSFGFSAFLD